MVCYDKYDMLHSHGVRQRGQNPGPKKEAQGTHGTSDKNKLEVPRYQGPHTARSGINSWCEHHILARWPRRESVPSDASMGVSSMGIGWEWGGRGFTQVPSEV